jgi:hypothetical protein
MTGTTTRFNSRRLAVAKKRWVLFLLAAAMMAVLAGCSSSTANVENHLPPPASQVTIAFQPEPAGSLAVNGSENLTAVVTNDPNNYGVDWSLSCQGSSGNCGTICLSTNPTCGNTKAHTDSCPTLPTASCTAIYTAPASISTNSTVVEIVAYASADDRQNVVAPITIGSFDSSLAAGNYVLQAQGVENSTPYQFAGVITLDGLGNVTGGEQTVNSSGGSEGASILNTSSYFLGSDGRGTITLNWNDSNANTNGTEIFSFVFLTNSRNPQALISQIDSTGASATGTMDLQQAGIAVPSGSYAFVMNGTDVFDSLPLAFGGVFNIPSGQTAISGVTDEIIADHMKLEDEPFSTGSQVSSSPDTLGQVTFRLVGLRSNSRPNPLTVVLTGYIVDPAHIKLIESDTAAGGSVIPFGATGGLAIGQASGSYGKFNNGSLPLGTTYVFGVTGIDLSPNSVSNGSLPSTLTSAGLFAADGNGNLSSGFTDTFLQQNCVQLICTQSAGAIPGAQISASFTGTYSVDSSSSNSCGASSGTVVVGTGRACMFPSNFNPAPSPSYSPELFFYLTGLTGTGDPAALVLAAGDLGPKHTLHYPSIGTGIAYAQSSAAPAFSGDYGLSFTQFNSSGENDGTAQLNATSTTTPGSLSGLADINVTSSANLDQPFTGTFSEPTATAPFQGSLVGTNDTVASSIAFTPQVAVDYFFINPSQGFFVETDLVNATPPEQTGQVSLGYYVAQCPVTNPPTTCSTDLHAHKGGRVVRK